MIQCSVAYLLLGLPNCFCCFLFNLSLLFLLPLLNVELFFSLLASKSIEFAIDLGSSLRYLKEASDLSGIQIELTTRRIYLVRIGYSVYNYIEKTIRKLITFPFSSPSSLRHVILFLFSFIFLEYTILTMSSESSNKASGGWGGGLCLLSVIGNESNK